MSTARAAALFTLAIAPLVASASHAWVPYRTAGGLAIQWRSAPLIEVAPPPAGPGASVSIADPIALVLSAYAPWIALPCDPPNVSAVASETAVLDATDLRSSVVWFTDKAAWNQRFSSLELARTILIHKVQSGTIVEADIAVNLGGFAFAAAEACDPVRYDLQGTLTHELGHFFGLDHSEVPEATMARRSDPGDCSLRTLSPDDEAGFCATYDRPEPADEAEPGPEVAEPAPEIVEAEVELVTPRAEGCSAGPGATLMTLVLSLCVGRASARYRRARPSARARS